VIGVQAVLGHHAVPFDMRGPFAALVIQQVTDMIDLTAVADRRAQHGVRLVQVGQDEAAGSSNLQRRLLQKNFPMLLCLFQEARSSSRSLKKAPT